MFARLSVKSFSVSFSHLFQDIPIHLRRNSGSPSKKNRCMLNVYTLHVKTKKIVECSNIKFIKEANPYSNRYRAEKSSAHLAG